MKTANENICRTVIMNMLQREKRDNIQNILDDRKKGKGTSYNLTNLGSLLHEVQSLYGNSKSYKVDRKQEPRHRILLT